MVPHDSCPVCRNAFLIGYYDDDVDLEGDEENYLHPNRSSGQMEFIGNRNETSARDVNGNQNVPSAIDVDGNQNEPLARDVVAL